MGRRYTKLNDVAWLRQKYEEEELSTQQLAELVGCHRVTVVGALHRNMIYVRSVSEARRNHYPELKDKRWLRERYEVEKLTPAQIGVIVKCGRTPVTAALHRAGIHIRTASEAHTGSLHHNFGKNCSEETKKRISEGNKGKQYFGKSNHMFGKKQSADTKRMISIACKGKLCGEKHPMWGKHPSESTRQKLSKARRSRRFPQHHTKPELQFETICTKYNLPFKYTGDGALWIGVGKEKKNPDFVGTNGNKNVVVEIFGNFWHDPALNPKVRESATYEYRSKHFKEAGYHMIVFWGSELKQSNAEELVLERLSRVGSLYEH